MAIKLIYIFLLGLAILVGALALNFLATKLGLVTWYDYVKKIQTPNSISYIWLFFIYPLLLGLIAYVVGRWFGY